MGLPSLMLFYFLLRSIVSIQYISIYIDDKNTEILSSCDLANFISSINKKERGRTRGREKREKRERKREKEREETREKGEEKGEKTEGKSSLPSLHWRREG